MFENVLKDHNAIIKETQKMILASNELNKDKENPLQMALSNSIGTSVKLDG